MPHMLGPQGCETADACSDWRDSPAEQCTPSATGSGESGSRLTAAAAPAAPSQSFTLPPGNSTPRGSEAPSLLSNQPIPDVDFGLETESLLDNSERDVCEVGGTPVPAPTPRETTRCSHATCMSSAGCQSSQAQHSHVTSTAPVGAAVSHACVNPPSMHPPRHPCAHMFTSNVTWAPRS